MLLVLGKILLAIIALFILSIGRDLIRAEKDR